MTNSDPIDATALQVYAELIGGCDSCSADVAISEASPGVYVANILHDGWCPASMTAAEHIAEDARHFTTLALTVKCPTCKSAPGVPCTRRVYRDGWTYHLTRADKAVRRERRQSA